jgi:hypothetical protein
MAITALLDVRVHRHCLAVGMTYFSCNMLYLLCMLRFPVPLHSLHVSEVEMARVE